MTIASYNYTCSLSEFTQCYHYYIWQILQGQHLVNYQDHLLEEYRTFKIIYYGQNHLFSIRFFYGPYAGFPTGWNYIYMYVYIFIYLYSCVHLREYASYT